MENYKNESMVDVAYSILKQSNKKVFTFKEMYDEVATCLELSEEEKMNKMSKFYTNLTLDGRFVTLGDNTWDLRENQTYDKVHIDVNDVYSDIEEEIKNNIEDDDLTEEEKEALGITSDEDEDDVSGESDDFDSKAAY